MGHMKAQVETQRLAAIYSNFLSDDELSVFDEIVKSYIDLRVSVFTNLEESVQRDVNIVKSYVTFTQVAPWECEEDDFIAWSVHLRNHHGIVRSTLRLYHGVVRRFYEYFTKNTKFSKLIRSKFGINPSVICDRHVCVAHVTEIESSGQRNLDAFSYDDIDHIFDTLERMIEEARAYGGCKDLKPLLRDKALIFLTYAQGLRAHEALGLNIDSFMENPQRPQFGSFGRIRVWGKGHGGSGKKPRLLPTISIDLPGVLYHYITEIRPEFLSRADANDKALFFSERCKRLSYNSFWNRFHRLLDVAGLGGKGFALHTLRRTGLSHCAQLMSLQTVKEIAGHEFISSTGLYVKQEEKIVMQEVDSAIDRQISEAMRKK